MAAQNAAQNQGATEALKDRVAAAQAPVADDTAAVMAAAKQGQQSDYDAPRRPQGKGRRGGQGRQGERREPTQSEVDERQVTEMAAALRSEEQRYFAERREELRRAARRGDNPPPRQNRVLNLITQAPDASDPYYANGERVEKEKGYFYRWARKIGDDGRESRSRIRFFQQYGRFEEVKDPQGGAVTSEFGVLVRAKVVDAAAFLISRASNGVMRRRDTTEVSYEMAEQINSAAGTEVIRVREDPRYNQRRRELVSNDWEPSDMGADE